MTVKNIWIPAFVWLGLIVVGSGELQAQLAQLLVADCGNGIVAFDGDTGEFITEHTTGACMVDVAVGPDDALYATGIRTDTVYRIDAMNDGAIEPFVVRSRDARFDRPTGLTFGPDGNLYLASSNTGEIFRFDGRTADFIDVFANLGTATPDQPFPEAIKFGPDGHLYVTSFNGTSVRRFHGQTGAFIDVFTQGGDITTSRQIAFDPNGDLFVASLGTDRILKYDGLTGQFLHNFALSPSPNGIAFGPDGNLYVASEGAGRVFRFDGQTGESMGTFAGPAGLTFPIGITFFVIPEPATGLMLLAGVITFMFTNRRGILERAK